LKQTLLRNKDWSNRPQTSIVGNVFLLLNPKYYIILGLDRMA
jgi:hypothetical protein